MDMHTINLKVELRQATGRDFRANHHILYGRIYYLRSYDTKKFEGPYTLKESEVNDGSFKKWLDHDMVFVSEKSGVEE